MKRIALAAAIAALGTSPAIVDAQQPPPASSTTIATTPPKDSVTFEQLLTALRDTTPPAQQLAQLDSLDSAKVQIVDVKELATGQNKQLLDSALASQSERVDSLQNVLGAMAVITAALDSSTAIDDATAKDVIALDVTEQGQVLVFVYRTEGTTGTPTTRPPTTSTPPASTPPVRDTTRVPVTKDPR